MYKAKLLTNRLGVPQDKLQFSYGWLQKFKECNGIHQQKLEGEAASVDQVAIVNALPLLYDKYISYPLKKIYNIDETGLFYQLESDRCLILQYLSRYKKNKEHLSIILYANADILYKLNILIIGKYKNLYYFKNINIHNFPIYIIIILKLRYLQFSSKNSFKSLITRLVESTIDTCQHPFSPSEYYFKNIANRYKNYHIFQDILFTNSIDLGVSQVWLKYTKSKDRYSLNNIHYTDILSVTTNTNLYNFIDNNYQDNNPVLNIFSKIFKALRFPDLIYPKYSNEELEYCVHLSTIAREYY
ncbi:hypothetical protein BC938DRAFT_472926 [Jimgerdemannia flammicorona]|uniref:HTH CENPB-type domain-containing protein n=1 Tax=Jimgerdemannia flammicorona TaxID=994334 RepID=A0A433QTQ4_9FUNG|nr:hypothetical protein BC938DRAFT_472926 [Jimgerdemannia flammicorona]